MLSYFKMVKRWDIIVIVFLVFLSFLPVFLYAYFQAGKVTAGSQNVAVISVNGHEIERINLSKHKGTELLDIPEIDCNPETVEVKEQQIRIKKSSCPEQICVRTGYISEPSQTIICLPHKVIIEVQTVDGGVDDEIIISS